MDSTIDPNPTPTQSCPSCGRPLPDGAPEGLCPRCLLAAASQPTETGAETPSPTMAPPLARVAAAFPQLEILDLVGTGGMGAVYKARQRNLDRLVALKILSESLARSPAFVERFNREARILARLNHPNIVTLHEFGQTDGLCYLLMEFVDGVSLRQALQADRFAPQQALALVPKICEALQYAHEEGVLHRDIKPANILLDTRGRVKIADFGIAKLVGDAREDLTLTERGATLGTPAYMAPEQLERPTEVDHRADIYSLGVVLYEMLTGELPLGRFAPPSERTPLDERLDAIVRKARAAERDARQQSAAEVKTAIEGVATPPSSASGFTPAPAAAAAPASSLPPTPTPPTPRRWNRRAIAASICLVLSFALGATAVPWLLYILSGRGSGFRLVLIGGVPLLASVGCVLASIVLGLAALAQIRHDRPHERGRTLAWLCLLTWPTLLVLGVPVLGYFTLEHRETVGAPPPSPTVSTDNSHAPTLPTPGLPTEFSATDQARHQILTQRAEERVAEARARHENGTGTEEELAEAERDLAVAQAAARGDSVGAARAHLAYAEFHLAIVRKKVEVGVLPPDARSQAEADLRLRQLDLAEALQRSSAPAVSGTRR